LRRARTGEPVGVEDDDASALDANEPVALEAGERPRHDLARAAEFGGDRLMGGLDRAVAGAGDEEAGEPLGQGVEQYVLDDDDEFADPLGVIAQDGAAERRILGQQPFESGDRHQAGRNVGFGDRFGEHRLLAQQGRGGEQAGIAGGKPIEHDLAAGVGGQPDPHAPALDDDPAARGIAGAEDGLAGVKTHRQAADAPRRLFGFGGFIRPGFAHGRSSRVPGNGRRGTGCVNGEPLATRRSAPPAGRARRF